MDKKRLKRLLSGFLKNKLDKHEKQLVQNWYDHFSEDENEIPAFKHKITTENLEREMLAAIDAKLQPKKKPTFSILHISLTAAACMALVSLSALWYFRFTRQQKDNRNQLDYAVYSTAGKQLKKIILSDSSIVYLNANSRIKVPIAFAKKQRSFMLEEGEAYFEIKRDVNRPFIISVQQLKVRVLGTTFNISAYQNNRNIKVNVTSGRVRVSDPHRILKELTKDQQITYHKKDFSFSLATSSREISKGWIEGKIRLRDAGFEDLAQAIYNIYGIKINCKLARKDEYRYNMIIRSDKTLDQTLALVCAIQNSHYKRENNEILIY